MTDQISTTTILVIILLLIVGLYLFYRCSTKKEGLSRRLSVPNILLESAYERAARTPYTQDWKYKMDKVARQRPAYLGVTNNANDSFGDDFTSVYKCKNACDHLRSSYGRIACTKRCMVASLGDNSMQQMHRKCYTDDECASDELCVMSGPYSGGNGGYCMSDNEPGIPRQDILEGYSQLRAHRGSSAWGGNPESMPFITVPGSTLPDYGVGFVDPIDVPYVNPTGQKIHLIADR